MLACLPLLFSAVCGEFVIDTFSTSVGGPVGRQNGTAVLGDQFFSVQADPNEVLGGERDLTVTLLNATFINSTVTNNTVTNSTASNSTVTNSTVVQGNFLVFINDGQLRVRADKGVVGQVRLDYDGRDNSSNIGSFSSPQDLTQGGNLVSLNSTISVCLCVCVCLCLVVVLFLCMFRLHFGSIIVVIYVFVYSF